MNPEEKFFFFIEEKGGLCKMIFTAFQCKIFLWIFSLLYPLKQAKTYSGFTIY